MSTGFPPVRKYLDDDELGIPDCVLNPVGINYKPVKRNDIFWMLGHKLRITTVKETPRFYDGVRERRVFLTCDDGCNCGHQFAGRYIYPVKLQILERHLHEVQLDKL